MDVLKVITSTAFLFSIIRVTTPLLYGSLSSLMSELSGVSNIGIEGMMLTCALTGVLSSAFFGGNAWIGLLVAMLVWSWQYKKSDFSKEKRYDYDFVCSEL